MAQMRNGAVVGSQLSAGRGAAPRVDTRMWLWGAFLLVIGIAAVTAVVITAAQGLTTVALIITLLTAAFFSRVGC